MGLGIWRPGLWLLGALFAILLPIGGQGQSTPTIRDGEAAPSPISRAKPAGWSIAFNYAHDAPLDELKLFDVVVVEPDHGHDPIKHRRLSADRSELFAYVSVGEVHPSRHYFKALPAGLLQVVNPDWGSHVVDQTHPQWAEVFVTRIIAPLWERGYRGFFLDTLDSYRLLGSDAVQATAQQQALEALIERLPIQFPGIRLIANRGFEMLPRLHQHFEAVAAESVLRGWHSQTRSYVPVAEADRQWLLEKLRETQNKYGLPAIAIDYVPPQDREATRSTARELQALGLIPWVSDAKLYSLGIGLWEVMPRRVLVLHDQSDKLDLSSTEVGQNLLLPLQHLGLVAQLEYWSNNALETRTLADRYAGVVVWSRSPQPALAAQIQRFYNAVLDQKVPLVIFNGMGTEPDAGLLRRLGLARTVYRPVAGQPPVHQASWVGFERQPVAAVTTSLRMLKPKGSALRFTDTQGSVIDPVAITDWGGYAMAPFVINNLGVADQRRWVIDPLEFLRQSLKLEDRPVPDLTTAGGRRLAFAHIDGDGFASRAELPRAPFAAQIMLDQFIRKYRLPHTVSVIEAEVAGHGLFSALAPALKDIARNIFSLDHVEIASHSFSHPYRWQELVAGGDKVKEGASLVVPGYTFDLQREIAGSSKFIDQELAPPGKRTQMFLWSGDAQPPADAFEVAAASGLLTMNGGDTVITRSYPSWSAISAHYLNRDGHVHVYAPVQSEMLYTNLWSGPFHGFSRVIETYEMTESPQRFKPINLYYHTYSASKPASIAALDSVYRWITEQAVFPIYASQFVSTTHDFDRLAIGRAIVPSPLTYRVASTGALQSLRWSETMAREIDWRASQAVAGAAVHPTNQGQTYLHLTDARAELVMQKAEDGREVARPVHVAWSNSRISDLRRTQQRFQFVMHALAPAEFGLSDARQCEVFADDRLLKEQQKPTHPQEAKALGPVRTFSLPRNKAYGISEPTLVSVRC